MNNWHRVAALLCLWAFSPQPATGNPLLPIANQDTGKKIFEKHCKVCHGMKGDGATFSANALNPPPRNFTSSKSKQELTLERMLTSIAEGRKGTAMMPWESVLSKAEIHSTVLYIRKALMHLPE